MSVAVLIILADSAVALLELSVSKRPYYTYCLQVPSCTQLLKEDVLCV